MSQLSNKQLLYPLSGSFTGSLLGSASYATTASYALNGGTGGGSSNLIFSGSVTASVNIGNGNVFSVVSGSTPTTLLVISASGNVGIGTSTPSYSLDVNAAGSGKNSRFRGALYLDNYIGGGSRLSFLRPTDGAEMYALSAPDYGTLTIGGGNQNNIDIYGHTEFLARFNNGATTSNYYTANIYGPTQIQPTGSYTGNYTASYMLNITGSGASGSFNANGTLIVSASNTIISGSQLTITGSTFVVIGNPSTNDTLKNAYFLNGQSYLYSAFNIHGPTNTFAPASNAITAYHEWTSDISKGGGSYRFRSNAGQQLATTPYVLGEDQYWGAYNTSGLPNYSQGAYIRVTSTQKYIDTSSPAKITFGTTPSGSITPIERLVINDDGRIAITGSLVVSGSTTIQGNLLPGGPYSNNTSSFTLGSPTAAWKDLYIGPGTLVFLSGSASSSISLGTSNVLNMSASVFGTASYALTASFSPSYVLNSSTGSFATTGSNRFNGNQTITGSLTITGSTTASGLIARGAYFNNTLVAAANNDDLVAFEIIPSYTNGSFTGVNNSVFRIKTSAVNNNSSTGVFTIQGVDQYGQSGVFQSPVASYTGNIWTVYKAFGPSGEAMGFGTNFVSDAVKYTGIITSLGSYILSAFNSTKNVAIGTTTDNGFKLDVSGSGRFTNGLTVTGSLVASGSLAVTGSTFLTAIISGSVAANNPSSSILTIGGTIVSPTGITGSSVILATPIISASANNQTLVGLDINPIIVTGSFTGLSALAGKFNGNVLMGQVPAFLSAYTYVPLTLCNSLAAGLKTQLALVNSGGGSGAGSAIDFFTYTDQGNGNPAVRIAGVDDGNFSNNLQILTKVQGSSGNGALTTKVQLFGGTGNLFVGTSPTDAGYKLDVNGTARIQGATTISTGGLTVTGSITQNASTASFGGLVGIGTTPSYPLDINLGNAGNVRLIGGTGNNNGFIQAPYSNFLFTSNMYYDGTNFKYEKTGFACNVQCESSTGTINLNVAPSGVAGAITTTINGLKLYNNGNVQIPATTDAGYKFDVSGSSRFIGGLTITGSLVASGSSHTILGTLNATSSQAVSSSYALTASYALNAGGAASTFPYSGIASISGSLIVTGSTILSGSSLRIDIPSKVNGYVLTSDASGNATWQAAGAGSAFPYTGSASISGSLAVNGPITASLSLISGSGTQRLVVVGSGSALPIFSVQGASGELFSITDSLSGSLFSVSDISGLPILETFSDSTTLMGNYLAPALYTTTRVTSIAGVNTIYSVPTASYDGIFVDYTVRSGSNARAGQMMAMWSASVVNFTETTTTDFGTTSTVTFGASISGSSMIVSSSTTTAGWTIKSIIRSI